MNSMTPHSIEKRELRTYLLEAGLVDECYDAGKSPGVRGANGFGTR